MLPILAPAVRRLQATVPAATLVFLAFFEALPLGLPHGSVVMPLFTVIGVYYWSIYRPDLVPAPVVFAIGLLHDLLAGGPIGLMALLLVALHALCAAQRRVFVGKSFAVGWWGFAMVAIGVGALDWLVASLYYLHLMNPRPLFVQLILTVVLYPALNWLFNRAEMTVLRTN